MLASSESALTVVHSVIYVICAYWCQTILEFVTTIRMEKKALSSEKYICLI